MRKGVSGSLLALLLSLLGAGCAEARRGAAFDAGPHPDGQVCERPFDLGSASAPQPTGLRINEVLSANDGVNLDERGEADDWVELINASDQPIALDGYLLNDGKGGAALLPSATLAPGETYLLWADDDPSQGERHLPLKISASGEPVVLWAAPCVLVEAVEVPALPSNESYARLLDGGDDFGVCRYASPGRSNDGGCRPSAPPELPGDVSFAPYVWSSPWPAPEGPLSIVELALGPAPFVELLNVGAAPVALSEYTLRVSAHSVGPSWPGNIDGAALPLPLTVLAPAERQVVALSAEAVAALEASPEREGVVSLFRNADAGAVDRLDFMRFPEGAALVREPGAALLSAYCSEATPGRAGACTPLGARAVADRLRHLRTPGDFAALAAGGTEIGQSAVKFILDLQAGGVVHLLGASWALHYTFARERIYAQPPLDRCDPEQSAAFTQGWYEFSVHEYFQVEGRRFLLGTLVEHANGLHTVEFASGDAISAEQMKQAFFSVVAHTPVPSQWALRPQDPRQLQEMRKLDGQLPIVAPNAPFHGMRYQPLTHGVGFGVLKFVPAEELAAAQLGPQVIVVTDDVPNDIPFVGGLVTESFQTPLAHVNVLSQARGTPNMALRDAREDPRLKALFGKLVRIEVGNSDFDLRSASVEEADVFYQAQKPAGPRLSPAHENDLRGVVALSEHGIADALNLGAKAAQFAELYRVTELRNGCAAETVPLNVPRDAFAVPFVHYEEHLRASGAEQALEQLLADPAFRADPALRAQGLDMLRALVTSHPVDLALVVEVESAIRSRFGKDTVRVRSSSNVEDLPTFNGAGLHTSSSANLSDPDASVADALRAVWASLWNMRAYDEREFANLDQRAARMAILVHGSFQGEGSQGVGISRNLLDVTRSDIYYLNAQLGEATVTNPAPSVTTEQLLYTWPPRVPELTQLTLSSLNEGRPVLSVEDARAVACALASVDAHFRPLVDPGSVNRVFAMQIEFKITRGHQLFVKQARPQPFGRLDLPKDCREL